MSLELAARLPSRGFEADFRVADGETVAVLGEAEVAATLGKQFVVPIANTPAEFRAVLKAEHDRWAPIIAAAGLKAE